MEGGGYYVDQLAEPTTTGLMKKRGKRGGREGSDREAESGSGGGRATGDGE